MEEKQTEFSPETDFILIRWFRPSDQDAVTELVEAGLKSYGVRKWNNKVGALKTPLGYTTKEALRACFDAYVEHVKTQDLGSISVRISCKMPIGLGCMSGQVRFALTN